MHSTWQVAFLVCPYDCTLYNNWCCCSKHHTSYSWISSLVKCFTKYFKLTFYDWSAKRVSHDIICPNIHFHLNQGPPIGYLQTIKPKHSNEANCVSVNYRLFPQKFQIFKLSFIYSTTIHVSVFGSCTSASVQETDITNDGWLTTFYTF